MGAGAEDQGVEIERHEEPLSQSLCTEPRPGAAPRKGLRRDARPRLGIGRRRRRCQRGRSRGARRTRDSADESMGLVETVHKADRARGPQAATGRVVRLLDGPTYGLNIHLVPSGGPRQIPFLDTIGTALRCSRVINLLPRVVPRQILWGHVPGIIRPHPRLACQLAMTGAGLHRR